jgi:hypothetical protein
MVMTAVGISALIGVALGQRFNVLILIPTIILAMVSVAIMEVARGDEVWPVALTTIILVATVLQIGYLVWNIIRGAVEDLTPLTLIQKHMEVVGSDGKHVGTIDHTESADRIVLTGDDPKASGKPHLISVDWVDYVDSKVHLNKPSKKAISEWRIAA